MPPGGLGKRLRPGVRRPDLSRFAACLRGRLPLLRRPWTLAALAVALLAGSIVGIVAFLPSESGTAPVDEIYADVVSPTPSRTPTATPTRASVLSPTPTVVATPIVYIAPVTRLRIPRIGVDAPVQQKGIDASNTMENPDGPEVVAWYGFTAKPGLGAGNAVFSGHVDYRNYGRAVFWDVGKLVEGDLIEVVLDDGTIVQFSVTATQSYHVAEIPMDEVLASTSTESVTLITCTGQFTQGAYSHRLVVRAIRVGLIPAET